jgi:hypothetical protein
VQGALLLLQRSCPPGQTEQLYFLCVDCPENTMKPTPGTGKCLRCPEGSRSEGLCLASEFFCPVVSALLSAVSMRVVIAILLICVSFLASQILYFR